MLFLVATPIGNLNDITLRALDTLKSCDLILCEDTRTSIKLLNHYQIKKPLLAYHKFNETSQIKQIIEKLQSGLKICLISDAGTPLISDPGYKLVEQCIKENIEITSIPGPCAAIDALLLSGLDTQKFQFVGFLPKKVSELKSALQDYTVYPGTTICYESPERLLKTLELLKTLNPGISTAVARELTKIFEEVLRGTAQELCECARNKPLKGECVLMIQGKERKEDFSHLSIQEHIALVEETYSLTRKEAIKLVAEQRQLPKRAIYKQTID